MSPNNEKIRETTFARHFVYWMHKTLLYIGDTNK